MRRLRTLLCLIPLGACTTAGVRLLSGRPAVALLGVERGAVPVPAAPIPIQDDARDSAPSAVIPALRDPSPGARPARFAPLPAPRMLTRRAAGDGDYRTVKPPVLPPATSAAAHPVPAPITPGVSRAAPELRSTGRTRDPRPVSDEPEKAAPPPPLAPDAASPHTESAMPVDGAPDTSIRSQQCQGITRSGERCRRKTRDTSGYCYQHRSQVVP